MQHRNRVGRGHRSLSAQFGGPRQRGRRGIDRHDPSTKGDRDHDRRESDTTAAEHREPLLGLEPGLCGEGMESGGEAAAQNRGSDEIHRVRKSDQIEICGGDCHLLSEGAGPAEAGLGLLRADLSLPGPTPVTSSTPVDKRHSDPIPNCERRNLRARLGDDSGELMTRYVRQRNHLMATPGMPVRSADARRLHLDHGTIGWTLGRWHLGNAEQGTNCVEHNCTHSPRCTSDRRGMCRHRRLSAAAGSAERLRGRGEPATLPRGQLTTRATGLT